MVLDKKNKQIHNFVSEHTPFSTKNDKLLWQSELSTDHSGKIL